MATYTSNYGLSKPENTDTMASFMNDYAANMETIDQNLGGGGGGGGGGHTIIDENGNTMPTRSKLKFMGNVAVIDDSANGQTIVDVRDIYSETEQVIGTWMGKPLYQICIPFSGITIYGNSTYNWDVSAYAVNYERIFLVHDMCYYLVNGTIQRSFVYPNTSPVQPPNVILGVEVTRSNISGHITIRYTKTTDPTP